jgi:hypothetical protein
MPIDKVLSPDIRVVQPEQSQSYYDLQPSFRQNHFGGKSRRVSSSTRNIDSQWKNRTTLIRPKDSLNLFGNSLNQVKENLRQGNENMNNECSIQRGILDFPAYDILQKNQSMYMKINQELSREIERKRHLESQMSKIPVNLNRYQVRIVMGFCLIYRIERKKMKLIFSLILRWRRFLCLKENSSRFGIKISKEGRGK